MPRASYLQRLAAGRSAGPVNTLMPARPLFAPRSSLPEAAFVALHDTSAATAPVPRQAIGADAETPAPSERASAPSRALWESAMAAVPPPPQMATAPVAAPRRVPQPLEPRPAPAVDIAAPRPAAAARTPASAPSTTPVTPARQAPSSPPLPAPSAAPPARVELAPPPPRSPDRPVQERAAAGSSGVHIGHLEVRIVPPPAPPARPLARRAAPRPAPAPLARGFRSFGLAQV